MSDIHGNLVALKTVVTALRKQRVDRVVCLGDVAATGPQPRQTISLLKELSWPCVLGNTDESLAGPEPADYAGMAVTEDDRRRMQALDRWTREQLRDSDKRFLSAFKPTMTVGKGRSSILCYHGSPRSNKEGIPPTTEDSKLREIFGLRDAAFYAGGHTHTPMVRRFGGSFVINPGSVGLPVRRGPSGEAKNPAWAEYAILSTGVEMGVELLRKEYSLRSLAKSVEESGMPEPSWWLADWSPP